MNIHWKDWCWSSNALVTWCQEPTHWEKKPWCWEQFRAGWKRVIENKMVGWHSRLQWTCCYCCCSVAQSCLTLCGPMDCSTPSFPVLHYLPEFAQTHVHCRWCHPTISFSVAPFSPPALNLSGIRVFSNESALHIKWPKYWSFSFSISPSNEYSGFISFRIDWLPVLAAQRTL